jgi:hypothetical protein
VVLAVAVLVAVAVWLGGGVVHGVPVAVGDVVTVAVAPTVLSRLAVALAHGFGLLVALAVALGVSSIIPKSSKAFRSLSLFTTIRTTKKPYPAKMKIVRRATRRLLIA